MKTYFIEPGDWESATGESLPSGSNGIAVVPAAELRKAMNIHEAFGEWLCVQIEDADAAYRKHPIPEMAIRSISLKQIASKHQAFLRGISPQEQQCEDSK